MLLALFFSILTATYTVESSTSVALTGTAPVGSEATYSRSGTTGQKGQMTAGNSTTLQLTGWDGCVIDSVVLQMRSNKSAGAGSMTMHIGERTVWEIPDTDFANVVWNGSFTTNWVDISSPIRQQVQGGEDIQITIEASKNSLYINSYTFYYQVSEPTACEVRFVSGMTESPAPMSETEAGGGIVVPHGKDTLDWHFVGWSEQEVVDAPTCPTVWKAGDRYYPRTDCTLWAVYVKGENKQVRDYISGDYMIASAFWSTAMQGGVEDEVVRTKAVEIAKEGEQYEWLSGAEEDMVYHMDFAADSTVVIEHVATSKYVGFSGNKLSAKSSVWQYKVLEDSSLCVYYLASNAERMLTFGYGPSATYDDVVAYSTSVDLSKMKSDGLLLYSPIETIFTTWPFGRLDALEMLPVQESQNGKNAYIMQLGNYLLRIENGKKYLYLNY